MTTFEMFYEIFSFSPSIIQEIISGSPREISKSLNYYILPMEINHPSEEGVLIRI
jgi:hypothetical protein